VIRQLLKDKVDIKLVLAREYYKDFIKMCLRLGITWNGIAPRNRKTYLFVTNHKNGYVLTFTDEGSQDVIFFNNHKAKEVKYLG
jgi:hypothetical protein